MENDKDRRFIQIVRKMYEKEGWQVFRKGLAATVLRDFLWGSIYFPLYRYFKMDVFHIPPLEDLRDATSSQTWSLSLQTMKACCSAAAFATFATSFLDSAILWEQ
jgi:hypothetical protein